MKAHKGEVIVCPDAEHVATAAMMALVAAATGDGATVALSGGSTPRAMYEALRRPAPGLNGLLNRVNYFFGDERAVPNHHPESNVGLAMQGFLGLHRVSAARIHPLDGGASDLAAEAARATRAMHAVAPLNDAGVPVLDLVYLGMGSDGHTASLFPGTAALDDTTPGFVVNRVPQLGTSRLTLTFPVLNAARWVVILCTGESKASVLREILTRSEDTAPVYPIEHLDARRITWLLDPAAACLLH